MRAGAEYLDRNQVQATCRQCGGVIDARGGPRPANDQLQAIFPDAFNRPNWTIGPQESSPDYLKRPAGQYRTMQRGFRLAF